MSLPFLTGHTPNMRTITRKTLREQDCEQVQHTEGEK